MAPQHRGIGDLPSEILLHMAELMDTDTRERFVATNKGISSLINSYEHTISKHRAGTFMLRPIGNILSSSTEERYVLPKNTFSMVRELELRDQRIGRLLKECPKAFCLTSPPWLPCLTPRQQRRLAPILKRALYQCDRIADIAANVTGPSITPECYHAIVDGVYELPTAFSPVTGALNPLTQPHARESQIKYINSLSLGDIAGIFILVNTLGCGLTCCCSNTGRERKTVIEECVLRHGTWFVWCRLLGDPGMQELAGYVISAGRAELRQWEAGNIQGPPGLKMTLIHRFNMLLGGGNRQEIAARIEETLRRLVLDNEKERAG
ncbi:hypothetical protein F4859DRAFT_509414 [Xylaria cf. heliscus]|nr:hypothetical protein F4859DRAFT_509414 [Xylaria cf. heliscus]